MELTNSQKKYLTARLGWSLVGEASLLFTMFCCGYIIAISNVAPTLIITYIPLAILALTLAVAYLIASPINRAIKKGRYDKYFGVIA